MSERERQTRMRSAPMRVERRADGKSSRIVGHAAVFNEWTTLYKGRSFELREIIRPGAFRNALAEGLAYFDIGGVAHSPDHTLLAYATDDTGSEYYTLKLRDIRTGEHLPDTISDIAGGAVWKWYLSDEPVTPMFVPVSGQATVITPMQMPVDVQ